MKTTIGGKTYRITYRPQRSEIFKRYGGFENWRAAKIASLTAKGAIALADWYRTANALEIGRRDGQIAQKVEIK